LIAEYIIFYHGVISLKEFAKKYKLDKFALAKAVKIVKTEVESEERG